MKAVDFIKVVRQDLQELYDLHCLSIESDGTRGLRCLKPDILEKQMRRSDREIIELYLSKGANIDDADEFLLNTK